MSAAQSYFERGKNEIEANGAVLDPAAAALELSWQDNGLALLDSMAARAASPANKIRLLDSAMRRELLALRRIARLSGADVEYLKFNLVANCVLLLEIQGKYLEARRHFDEVFGKYIRNTNNDEFLMSYFYRIGSIAFRSGDISFAREKFMESFAAATNSMLHYSRSRIALALATLEFSVGNTNDAEPWFIECQTMSQRQRDTSLLQEIGVLAAFYRNLTDSRDFRIRFQSLEDAGFFPVGKRTPRLPSKLPSYNPLVDMLPLPDVDLNKSLVGAQ
ncbi:hypothetical protein RvVAR0630_18480 [Agrobacterium vitis]|nr:hypothetical protein RvVAR0630_18480 [Agrobacterium vitis]